MGPLFHACSPSPGRSGSVCAQVGFVFAGVRLVQARPSFPPSACLGVLPSASAFSFPLPFRPLRARCVGVGVLSWFLLSFFAFPVSCSC